MLSLIISTTGKSLSDFWCTCRYLNLLCLLRSTSDITGKKKKNWEIMQQFQSKLIMYHELINYSKLLQIMKFLHTVGHFTFFYQV